MNHSMSIAIIGAGPSGLSAADTLRQLGYRHITIFEKNQRVGGKVHSVSSAAGVVELGAVLASAECELVLGLARRLNIPLLPYPAQQRYLDAQGQRHDALSWLQLRYPLAQIQEAIRCYAAVLTQFADLSQDNSLIVHEDLLLSLDRFADKYGFTPVAELARSMLVGFGYGYIETVPALYYMKLLAWLFKPDAQGGLVAGDFYMFPTGFQSLWEAVASEHQVHLGAAVTALQRTSDPEGRIVLTINGQERHSFDALIIAAPLHTLKDFMPLTEEEHSLFSQLKSTRYIVSAFAADGLTTGEFLFLPENGHAAGIGHMNAWANRNPAVPVYLGWQTAAWTSTVAELEQYLENDVSAQGGVLKQTVLRQEWDYFPHVDAAEIRADYFSRIDRLQGQGRIYFVGSALNFETVEHSARQARALVQRCFGMQAQCNNS
ncbi:protoporphyrinogen/coproporphyrinogen oxidase [Undibacterium crateris]|uniref:protoporphyrinogen/coproporphyrinogen oxidase n=1 Tax=Undibacterium crateris TaxID=2528175 RepID=UPI0013898298|nr:FAD-dependent oxidoreductase [Undibacterium crateris]NDI85586.1 NAD(P)-binding protein [Undibacterium crateris]